MADLNRTPFAALLLVLVGCSGAAFEAGPAPGLDPQNSSGAAGQQTAGSAGEASAGGLAGAGGTSSAGAAGAGSNAGESGSAGSAGVSGAGAAGMAGSAGNQQTGGSAGSGCVPLTNTQDVCAGKECGSADDGCGKMIPCGTVQCWPDTNQVARECQANKCVVTCASAALECGGDALYPGLSCGACDAHPGGQCGLVERGVCAYCADQGPVQACPSGLHAWSLCGTPPVSTCVALYSNGQPLANQWCCQP